MLFFCGKGNVRKLGGDGDKCDAFGLEGGEIGLQGAQGEVAEGTPFASIEAYEEGSLGKELAG